VKGESTGGSDVDILVVSERIPRNNLEIAGLKIRIGELLNLPPYHPFEFIWRMKKENGTLRELKS
jgi:predicted nucleotidyltransferase